MPSLPKSVRRPGQPAPQKREYQPHAARSAEYNTARWQQARAAQLARKPCCEACAQLGRVTPATVCDHITPVRLGGDFWDTRNYQSLVGLAIRLRVRQNARKQPKGGRGSKSSGDHSPTP